MKAQPIIVVKKRVAHAGHHGGAWKVAYADFVTAMMAFFLVMWLVGQSKPVKAAIGGYFRDPGAFETQRASGSGILDGSSQAAEVVLAPPGQAQRGAAAEREALEKSVGHIRDRLSGIPDFKTLRDQIEFSVTTEGLRIDLLENDGSSFFDSGSATLRAETDRILGVIARELGTLDNAVVIEGHTDSRQYAKSDRYTNWELSTDRANAARRVMEGQGLQGTQIVSVRGHADRQLRIASDPLDPRNRRVSIIVRSRAASAPNP
jgi:chemotaxis protein MotB